MMGYGIGMAGDDDIFAVGGFDEIDDIGHGDDSSVIVEDGLILYLEVFAFAEGLVYWVSFQHEW